MPMQETQETRVWSLGQEEPLEEEMATYSQYSSLENPMDRGTWHATVHKVAKNQSWLSTAQWQTFDLIDTQVHYYAR